MSAALLDSKLLVVVVSFDFQMTDLIFSRSDPISFADMATCDWLH